jgi:AcrR family transcriptional regulator
MSRNPDLKIRDQILEKVLSVLSKKGLNNLSLRDIARETGVSARMLIYHFKSYEKLMNSIFIQMSIKHKNILKTFMNKYPEKSLGQISEIYIKTILKTENKKPLLFFLELYTKALRDIKKYNSFFDEVLYNWIDEVENLIKNKQGKKSRQYATIIVSFYRGLMLDWLANNDEKRILESNKLFSIFIDDIII